MICRRFFFAKIIRIIPPYPISFNNLKHYSKKSSPRNPYEVLGLKNSCSTKDVKKAYIELCKELHPDIKPDDASQHKKFVELNNAYSILVNKSTRKEFDDYAERGTADNIQEWFYSHSASKTSSNPYDRSSTNENPWYDKDIYQKEREYFRKQKENSHIVYRDKHNWILWGCFLLVVVGYILYYAAYSYAKYYTLTKVDEKSRKIRKSYDDIVKKAGENGREKLFERWHKRQNPPE